MIAKKIEQLKSELPEEVKLIAVSKTKPETDILEAYNAGHRLFGENKVQELISKNENLPKDIEWHMIGHLQTNKVKFIAPFIHLIHSVDSIKLLKTIEKEAAKSERCINCLLQIKIASEESKFGFTIDQLEDLLKSEFFAELKHVQIVGLMGMATNTSDKDEVKKEFLQLRAMYSKLKNTYFADKPNFCELSMGMSHDYSLAVECGSTMVRIGSDIFGERNYSIK